MINKEFLRVEACCVIEQARKSIDYIDIPAGTCIAFCNRIYKVRYERYQHVAGTMFKLINRLGLG